MDDEDFWTDDPKAIQNSEWDKISNDFTNAGYREGITAGKESALQEGFDAGFASVGAPLGRNLGILRGLAAALLAFLARSPATADQGALAEEVRGITSALSNVRLSDIAPPDLEALAHAREHLEQARVDTATGEDQDDLTDPAALNEDLKAKRDMEGLEDLMAQMSSGTSGSALGANANPKRPTVEDVTQLQERLLAVARELGLELDVRRRFVRCKRSCALRAGIRAVLSAHCQRGGGSHLQQQWKESCCIWGYKFRYRTHEAVRPRLDQTSIKFSGQNAFSPRRRRILSSDPI